MKKKTSYRVKNWNEYNKSLVNWMGRKNGFEEIEFASWSPVDGIEVNLKSGQFGDKTYFGALQKGKTK